MANVPQMISPDAGAPDPNMAAGGLSISPISAMLKQLALARDQQAPSRTAGQNPLARKMQTLAIKHKVHRTSKRHGRK